MGKLLFLLFLGAAAVNSLARERSEPPLLIVTGLVLLMAAYDFWTSLRG